MSETGTNPQAGAIWGPRLAAAIEQRLARDQQAAEADGERILSVYDASIIASAMHARQVDKAGKPYREHLAQVAAGVRMLGGDDDDVIAAWFHDAVEDGHATPAQLESLGVTPTSLTTIEAVTKTKGESNRLSLERVLCAGPRAQRLKLADLLSNTRHDRVAILRTNAGDDLDALAAIDRRHATYQRWIQTIMVELDLLPVEVGSAW